MYAGAHLKIFLLYMSSSSSCFFSLNTRATRSGWLCEDWPERSSWVISAQFGFAIIVMNRSILLKNLMIAMAFWYRCCKCHGPSIYDDGRTTRWPNSWGLLISSGFNQSSNPLYNVARRWPWLKQRKKRQVWSANAHMSTTYCWKSHPPRWIVGYSPSRVCRRNEEYSVWVTRGGFQWGRGLEPGVGRWYKSWCQLWLPWGKSKI